VNQTPLNSPDPLEKKRARKQRRAERKEQRDKRRKISWSRDIVMIKRLLSYVKPYKGLLIWGIIAGVLAGAISGSFPKALKTVFHRLFEMGDKPSLGVVIAMALAIPLYFAIRGAVAFINSYFLTAVGVYALRDVRQQLFTHLQSLSMDFFVRNRVADLMQRMDNDTSRMRGSIVSLAVDLIKPPVTILTAIIFIGRINAWFCLVALILGAVCLVPIQYFGKKVRQLSVKDQKTSGRVLGILHETFTNMRLIKAYSLHDYQIDKYRVKSDLMTVRQLTLKRWRELLTPMIELIASLGIMSAILYIYFAEIPFSDFLAIVGGFYMMYEPLKKIAHLNHEAQIGLAAGGRVFSLMDSLPTVPECKDGITLSTFRDKIELKHVSLAYLKDKPILHNINLSVPHGSICALVGPSGAGKSSLVNLILRFYDPTGGVIQIDGHDLREVTTDSLRSQFGLVSQESLFFADTIAINIAAGNQAISREQIISAAIQANAHDFIMSLPEQYDTVLSDRGQNLSGGQQQRIAIARAIVRNPSILILDEATSALDSESETLVQEALKRVMKDRTVIVIAHRLSTIRHAHQIIVLNDGRIVETGTHQELLDASGLYRSLYELQFYGK
jgi:subfamily B ATP-binding cassette protein MsbA